MRSAPTLLHWQHLPVALREEAGVMIFSGSAVVDRTNSSGFCRAEGNDQSCLVAIYTGHTSDKQTQNLAYSNDRGRTWTKYNENPVLDLGLKDFRDPKVFWHEPSSRWVMAAVLADQHKVRFFGSRDLKRWETPSDFGPAGATGGVPRELRLVRLADGIRLVQRPIEELKTLRTAPEPTPVRDNVALPGSAEVEAVLQRADWREAGLRFKNSGGEEVVVGVSTAPLEVFVDRRQSRGTTFHGDYAGRHSGPLRWEGNSIRLRVLFDRSVLEVFGNDGQTVITERVYPTQPFDHPELLPGTTVGGGAVRMWPLRSVWLQH